jgi:hypothetical protein
MQGYEWNRVEMKDDRKEREWRGKIVEGREGKGRERREMEMKEVREKEDETEKHSMDGDEMTI